MPNRTLTVAALLLAGSAAQASVVWDTTLPLSRVGGTMIVGSGIPNDHFAVDTAQSGESVALKARDRDTGQANSVSNGKYHVDPGLSTVQSPGAPNLAFDFQFSPGAGGGAPSDYWLQLDVDFDPGPALDLATILLPLSDAGNSWDDGDGYFLNGQCGNGLAPVACAWDGADAFVYSQSWNLGFDFWTQPPFNKSYDPFAAGVYDLSFMAFRGDPNQGGVQLASVTIQAAVSAPASLALLGLGISAFGARRRTV